MIMHREVWYITWPVSGRTKLVKSKLLPHALCLAIDAIEVKE